MTSTENEFARAYPVPVDEMQRLEALAATGLLDTPAESNYDDIVVLASRLCSTPIALVTLIDRDRQWFKARVGVEIQETPRSMAFCNYPVAEGRTCVVPDTTKDARFSANAFVTGAPHVRFYAGAPLMSDGHALGSLCVLDTQPRQLTADQVHALEALARQVVREIQMRVQVRDLRELVTERNLAQEAIHASESVLRSFYDSSPFMMGVVELRGEETIHIAINRAAMAFTGIKDPAAVLNRSAADVGVPREIIRTWVRHYHEALHINGPVRFEYQQLRKVEGGERTGSPYSLLVTVSPIADSPPPHPRFSYMIEDVTESRRAARALAVSEERLQYALDATEEGVWDWNLTTDEVFYSARCFEMLGYQPNELPPSIESWKNVCHPEDLPEGLRRIQAHFEGQTAGYEFVHRCRHKDGHYVWLLSRGKVVKWEAAAGEGGRCPGSRPLRMVGTTLDVTDRKKAEEELRQAKEAAQDASASKSQFLANMSHEIRTPLTSILGYADLLEDETLAPAERDAFIQTIRRNGRHLLKLISDILDLSKIEANKVQLEQVAFNPRQLIAECVSLIRASADEKKISLDVTYERTVPEALHTDPTRVRQILTNLLGNAVKFTSAGSIRVAVRAEGAEGEERLVIDVVDTGIGLRHEQLAALFQPFTQADATTTRKFGGTGLGLVISRRLAQLLGGDISVASKPGRGSTFTFWMPLQAQESVRSAAVPRVASPLAEVMKGPPLNASILLAEDGVDNQILIQHVLRLAGARVTIAENGRITVEKAVGAMKAGEPFDLILMDMQMPKLDGYGAARRLRDEGVRTPIVALTANAMEGDRERCLAAGCDDFATKPIDMRELMGTIRRHLVQIPNSGGGRQHEGTKSTKGHEEAER